MNPAFIVAIFFGLTVLACGNKNLSPPQVPAAKSQRPTGQETEQSNRAATNARDASDSAIDKSSEATLPISMSQEEAREFWSRHLRGVPPSELNDYPIHVKCQLIGREFHCGAIILLLGGFVDFDGPGISKAAKLFLTKSEDGKKAEGIIEIACENSVKNPSCAIVKATAMPEATN